MGFPKATFSQTFENEHKAHSHSLGQDEGEERGKVCAQFSGLSLLPLAWEYLREVNSCMGLSWTSDPLGVSEGATCHSLCPGASPTPGGEGPNAQCSHRM